MNTKEKIMDVALRMFSIRGFEAVSIRDICGEAGIKESTIYYHFKNKQDILDSLVSKFENYISSLLGKIDIPSNTLNESENGESQLMDKYLMDSYLFDPFCNLMIRLMMIEQFHNEEMRQLYERIMFTQPYEIQKNMLHQFVLGGVLSTDEEEQIAQEFFSFMTVLTYKYLLNGELTEKRKQSYSREVHTFYRKAIMRWTKSMSKETKRE